MNNIRRLWQFFRADRIQLVITVLLLLLGTVATVLKPWPLALIVDFVLGSQPAPTFLPQSLLQASKFTQLLTLVAVLFALYAVQGLITACYKNYLIRIGLKGLRNAREQVFHSLQRQSLRFHDRNRVGDLIYRTTWDTYAFHTIFEQGFFGILNSGLSLTLMLLIMWSVNYQLSIVVLAVIPLIAFTMQRCGRRISQHSMEAHQADSLVASSIEQSIANLPLIQSYVQEAREERQFLKVLTGAFRKRYSQHKTEVVYLGLIALWFGLTTALVVGLGAGQVLEGRLSVGELLVFLAYLNCLYEPLNQLSQVGATISDARAGIQRVFEFLDTPQEVTEPSNPRPVYAATSESAKSAASNALLVKGGIVINDLTFGYQADIPVLRNASYTIGAQETICIVGRSGAGKTTLMQLLPRFYDPQQGSIQIDGIDIRELALSGLRKNIACVFQEPLLLPSTVAENIAYGCPESSMSDIQQAAQAAFADGFIKKLSHGYDTVLGDGATRLSVGEKQRINIARAFLKQAPILLLDEPTSALDSESEELVIMGINKLAQDCTTLIVSHRPNVLDGIDKVIDLTNGHLS
jgi:ATP-binding cassette, subfamily B, bacterial